MNNKMAILKAKEIARMNIKDINDKIKELNNELVKARVSMGKSGKANVGEIKKTVARLLTFKNKLRKNITDNIKNNKGKEAEDTNKK